MVVVKAGKNWKGEKCEYHLDNNLHKNLTAIKEVVSSKDFDYVALVCGLPGLGKSNFAISCCRYLDENFTLDNICFTDEEFIEKTTNAKPHTAIMLDESFASLNSRIGMTKAFLRIINHLQIIRQKNLYVFLCLPNFFDLSKGISIYRSSHLFVCYGEKFGHRGAFSAFDRDKKKMLYILGLKYMNYTCIKPNFRGRFVKQKAIDEEAYKERKLNHLKEQDKETEVSDKKSIQRDKLIYFLYKELGMKVQKISDITGMLSKTVYKSIERIAKRKNE